MEDKELFKKRQNMYLLAEKFGLSDPRVIKASQELDRLIIIAQQEMNFASLAKKKKGLLG